MTNKDDNADSGGNPTPVSDLEHDNTSLAEVGDLLDSGVGGTSDGDEPTSAELRAAWSGFADAARDLGQALASTAGDPEVRAGIKNAVQSLVDTVGSLARDAAGTAAEQVRKVGDTAAEQVRKVGERTKKTADTEPLPAETALPLADTVPSPVEDEPAETTTAS